MLISYLFVVFFLDWWNKKNREDHKNLQNQNANYKPQQIWDLQGLSVEDILDYSLQVAIF